MEGVDQSSVHPFWDERPRATAALHLYPQPYKPYPCKHTPFFFLSQTIKPTPLSDPLTACPWFDHYPSILLGAGWPSYTLREKGKKKLIQLALAFALPSSATRWLSGCGLAQQPMRSSSPEPGLPARPTPSPDSSPQVWLVPSLPLPLGYHHHHII